MPSRVRAVGVDRAHSRFQHTVFGFIREHQKSVSINVPSVVKYLCLQYYLLKEEWCSRSAQYPSHLFRKVQRNEKYPRTKYEVNEIVDYRLDSGQCIKAQVERLKKGVNGHITKLFLKFASNNNHVPYGWVPVPTDRLCAPHLIHPHQYIRCLDPRIQPTHFDAISGSVAVGDFDESITEYRWTFKLLQSRIITIGLRQKGKLKYFSSLPHDDFDFTLTPGDDLQDGDVFYVVLDVIGKSMRIERKGKLLFRGLFNGRSIAHCSLDNLSGRHFLVIRFGNQKSKRVFTMEHANRIVKFKGFTIRQKESGILTKSKQHVNSDKRAISDELFK